MLTLQSATTPKQQRLNQTRSQLSRDPIDEVITERSNNGANAKGGAAPLRAGTFNTACCCGNRKYHSRSGPDDANSLASLNGETDRPEEPILDLNEAQLGDMLDSRGDTSDPREILLPLMRDTSQQTGSESKKGFFQLQFQNDGNDAFTTSRYQINQTSEH